MKSIYRLLILTSFLSCNSGQKIQQTDTTNNFESTILRKNASHENPRMRYKLIESKVLDKEAIQSDIQDQLQGFSQADYDSLGQWVFEKDILSIQKSITDGMLTYKKLVQWYLFRINKYEFDSSKSLHTIIAINPNAVREAEEKDKMSLSSKHPIFGMPVLLKDNINTEGMSTTAGAIALSDNRTGDAFIVNKLKENGAIILGKVNLSEWAYFFCSGCPVGYSAIGGQTLNPYGRGIFESGGSSSGSATSMAANYAVAAVGTETSGSILSPASQNSVVGLKPTVGLLSRGGIVPISSSLDTPGPITRNVLDNAIMLSAMTGKDDSDPYSKEDTIKLGYLMNVGSLDLNGIKVGANKKFMDEIPMYAEMMLELNRNGVEIFGFDPKEVELDGFLSILNIDMKNDLPNYLSKSAGSKVKVKSIDDLIAFNKKDIGVRAPYGQELFEGILEDQTSLEELEKIKSEGKANARSYFDEPMAKFDLDVITSVNNYDAGRAALAHYPALTIPMGYKESGEPMNLTLIGKSLTESELLKIGYAIEQATRKRRPPSDISKSNQ